MVKILYQTTQIIYVCRRTNRSIFCYTRLSVYSFCVHTHVCSFVCAFQMHGHHYSERSGSTVHVKPRSGYGSHVEQRNWSDSSRCLYDLWRHEDDEQTQVHTMLKCSLYDKCQILKSFTIQWFLSLVAKIYNNSIISALWNYYLILECTPMWVYLYSIWQCIHVLAVFLSWSSLGICVLLIILFAFPIIFRTFRIDKQFRSFITRLVISTLFVSIYCERIITTVNYI